jgi:multidrug efflux pump subunit AcrB
LVAYIINPVFAVWFMGDPKREGTELPASKKRRRAIFGYAIFGLSVLYFYANKNFFMGNLLLSIAAFAALYKFALAKVVAKFQESGWPSIQRAYAGFLNVALNHPWKMLSGVVVLLVLSLMAFASEQRNIVLFPKADPNFIYVYMTLPVGTDVAVTDSLTNVLEKKVVSVIGENNPIVESVISNVALGASEDRFDRTTTSNKGKVGIAFVEFSKRNGVNTMDYLDQIRVATQGAIPGADIVVDQEQGGPPQPKPISVEIRGDDFRDLIRVSEAVRHYLDSLNIPGVEELNSDLIVSKPEINIQIDRERANMEGISTAQIGSEFRTAILGKEVTKFRDGEDEIPVNIRLKEDQRANIDAVENLNITFRDMNMGGVLRSVPMAALADVQYTQTYGGIRRLDQSRIVTISSNITSEYQPSQNEVIDRVKAAIAAYPQTEGVNVGFAGQDAEMKESFSFLGTSLLISIFIILLILITQFNSVGKMIIIMTEVVFSIIGVLLGMTIMDMDFSVIMSMVGIVALSGIVVRNGILLVEYTDILREQGTPTREAIVEAGRIRMTPVLLTATAAILGLIPLAVGLNIDFYSLFATGDPKIYLGGDSVAFWGPLSWTIIFGLSFATFITLIILPVMYLKGAQVKQWWQNKL